MGTGYKTREMQEGNETGHRNVAGDLRLGFYSRPLRGELGEARGCVRILPQFHTERREREFNEKIPLKEKPRIMKFRNNYKRRNEEKM